jgi:sugar lactone lactonase YvrE
VDAAGNIYIADTGNNRIRKVDAATGFMSTVVNANVGAPVGSKGDGGQGANALINNPGGLALDAAGNLYFADTGNNKIRKLATNGIITTVAGNQFNESGFSGDGGPATSAMLHSPQGVAVDAAGNLYIADRTNSRIRMVSPNGTISTIAGNGKFTYTGDGGPATSAALNFPDDVVVDSKGNLYVADYQNQVVRLLTPNGPPPGSNPPSIATGGVVSAAAFGGFTSIAPGSWIEIYG